MEAVTWNSLTVYEKNDVVLFGDNYFYCLMSNFGIIPTENNQINNVINPVWNTADNFYWMPTYDAELQHEVLNKRFNSDSGLSAIKDFEVNKNFRSINMVFDKLSDKEAAAILFFLEQKLGTIRFNFLAQNPYNYTNKYICKNWKHSWVFSNNNSISALFERSV